MRFQIRLLPMLIVLMCINAAGASGTEKPNVKQSDRVLQIIADETKEDAKSGICVADGYAVAKIEDQDAEIRADHLRFDRGTNVLTAIGNVQIIWNDMVTTGGSFSFNINSNEYLVTRLGTHVIGPKIERRDEPIGKDKGLREEVNGCESIMIAEYLSFEPSQGAISFSNPPKAYFRITKLLKGAPFGSG